MNKEVVIKYEYGDLLCHNLCASFLQVINVFIKTNQQDVKKSLTNSQSKLLNDVLKKDGIKKEFAYSIIRPFSLDNQKLLLRFIIKSIFNSNQARVEDNNITFNILNTSKLFASSNSSLIKKAKDFFNLFNYDTSLFEIISEALVDNGYETRNINKLEETLKKNETDYKKQIDHYKDTIKAKDFYISTYKKNEDIDKKNLESLTFELNQVRQKNTNLTNENIKLNDKNKELKKKLLEYDSSGIISKGQNAKDELEEEPELPVYDFETVNLEAPGALKHISTLFSKHKQLGENGLTLFISDSRAYPNIVTPLAGIIDYYKDYGFDTNLVFENESQSYASRLNISNPLSVEDEGNAYYLDTPFDKVWTFNSSKGIGKLVNSFILSLRKTVVGGKGIISGLEWCLNEVMDNVLVHSNASKGFAMAQYHQNNNQFNFCVFDCGIGIYKSFLESKKYRPRTPADAITLAIQEKVTRDDTVGQGNGLWGLHQIMQKGKGTLTIISSGALYKNFLTDTGEMNSNLHEKGYSIFGKGSGTTLVDFQVGTDSIVDVGSVLKTSHFIDLWEENMENDNGDYVIKINEFSEGTGTRNAALSIRNMALNLANNEGKKVIFDFDQVNTISSSYADELIGKIIADHDFYYFTKKFEIVNMNNFNRSILDKSVKQRMGQLYYDILINDNDEQD